MSRTAGVVAITAALTLAPDAAAQAWPARPVRILVPAPAGSSPDIRARQIAPKLQAALGQPFIVENRPGGAGLIAAREAARAAPDGHTLLLALINNAIFDALNPDPCCRLNQELVPVSRFTMTPLIVVVNASLQASSLKELIAEAKSKPGALTFASAGPGSIAQLVGFWVQSESGTRMLEVPYKGVNAEVPDLMSGQVMISYIVPQVVVAPIKAGKLRALAVLSDKRLSGLPDVPTTGEAGVQGADTPLWFGLWGPAAMPADLVARLNADVRRALADPGVRERLTNLGNDTLDLSPADFAKLVRDEIEENKRILAAVGVKPQ